MFSNFNRFVGLGKLDKLDKFGLLKYQPGGPTPRQSAPEYRIWLMMVMMMMMIFQGFCWAWPPCVPPDVVLGSQTFTTDGIAPAGNPLLASISCLLRHAREDSSSILLTPETSGGGVHTYVIHAYIYAYTHTCRHTCIHDDQQDHHFNKKNDDEISSRSKILIQEFIEQSTTLKQKLRQLTITFLIMSLDCKN